MVFFQEMNIPGTEHGSIILFRLALVLLLVVWPGTVWLAYFRGKREGRREQQYELERAMRTQRQHMTQMRGR
jgi:hypothetical protein